MPRTHTVLSLLSLAAVLLAFGAPASAQMRTETFRWNHSDPAEVDGYRLHYGAVSRSYTVEIEVGLPPVDGTGAHVYDLQVPEADSIYVAVSAYNADEVSAFSNEKFRAGIGAPPPDPPPDPEPQAAVLGFALWDANTDQVVDADFQSGEVIDLATLSCSSIEILGNTYLDLSQSPGSVHKVFDGQNQACNSAPTTHENSAPYAWETDRGPGQFDCAASLMSVGLHTLTVTPYDGDDCSGLAGPPVTLNFEIVDSSDPNPPPPDPDPPPPELGPPGQPQLLPPL